MKLELICIGDLKFKGLKEVEKLYLEKIKYFSPLNIRCLKDTKSDDDTLKKKKEGEMMLEAIEKQDFIIALDEHGKKMNSIQFAKILEEKFQTYPHRIVFIIGGHSGISEALNDRINMKISFSDMTFGHDIFRILFLEQLYRAFTIIKNIKYHR